jgi:hypothetical protein
MTALHHDSSLRVAVTEAVYTYLGVYNTTGQHCAASHQLMHDRQGLSAIADVLILWPTCQN